MSVVSSERCVALATVSSDKPFPLGLDYSYFYDNFCRLING